MTKELLDFVAPWGIGTLLTAAALFGFFPKFVVNLIVLVYPREHPRRRELPGELEVVPYLERLTWVLGQCATVLFEGAPARTKDLRVRLQEQACRRAEQQPEDNLPEHVLESHGTDSDPEAVVPESPMTDEVLRRKLLARAVMVTMGSAVFGPDSGSSPAELREQPTATTPRSRTTTISGGRFAGALVFERADDRPCTARDRAVDVPNARDLVERLNAFFAA